MTIQGPWMLDGLPCKFYVINNLGYFQLKIGPLVCVIKRRPSFVHIKSNLLPNCFK